MRTDERKKVKGKIIQLPEGNVTVLKESEPMMVMVKQSQLVERMDPGFWDPRWHREIFSILQQCSYPVKELGEFILPGTEGITYGSTRPREWSRPGQGVRYIKCAHVLRTGLDEPNLSWTPEGGNLDGLQYRTVQGDIIINKSGVGTAGRCTVVHKDFGKMVVSQDTMRVRVQDLKPEFVNLYLQSKFGVKQYERWTAGVGTVHIDFHEVKSIHIPVLHFQEQIASEYHRMASYHDLAMAAKAANNFTQAELYLQVAEGMLETLIAQVEWLIEGKQRTVTPLIPDNAPKSLQDAFTEQYRLIGKTIQRAERENWEGVEKIYGMRIYANPIIRDAIRRLLEQVEEVMAGKRKNVDPVL